jgi:hypothetical protein
MWNSFVESTTLCRIQGRLHMAREAVVPALSPTVGLLQALWLLGPSLAREGFLLASVTQMVEEEVLLRRGHLAKSPQFPPFCMYLRRSSSIRL